MATVPDARAARLLFQLPSKSRVIILIQPAAQWGWPEVLQNTANHSLAILAWQNENQGVRPHKQSPKPTLYIPDFLKQPDQEEDVEKHDIDEVKQMLAKSRV